MDVKALALIGDRDGCAMWRILQPFAELQRRGYPAEWGYRTDNKLANIAHLFNVIILPRLHWPKQNQKMAEQWFSALRNAGIAVIYEVDDDLLSPDFRRRLIEVHGKTEEQTSEIVDGIRHTLSMADGVTVSNEHLKRLVQRYTNKPVYVISNAIDLDWFSAVQAKAERRVPGLTIGWAGGIRPDADTEQMAIAWGRIAKKHPHVNFVVYGHQPTVIYDNVPHHRIFAIDWHPIETYPMGLVNFDIGCCPLSDTQFNRSKTFIKALEYAVSGAAVVASPTVYSGLIDDGYDGYICHTIDQWETALDKLVSSANHRQRMAQRLLYKTKTHHSLARNVLNWPAAWAAIYEEYIEARRSRPRIIVPTFGHIARVVA